MKTIKRKTFNLNHQCATNVYNSTTEHVKAQIIKETEKAIQIKFDFRHMSDNGVANFNGISLNGKASYKTEVVSVWIPKSIFFNEQNWCDVVITKNHVVDGYEIEGGENRGFLCNHIGDESLKDVFLSENPMLKIGKSFQIPNFIEIKTK